MLRKLDHVAFQLLLIILYAINVIHGGGHWGYEGESGPEHWAALYPEYCSGNSQSPIDINTSNVSCQSPAVTFVNYNYQLYPDIFNKIDIENNGHTAQVSGENIPSYITTSFDNAAERYNFLQFHFHWGKTSKEGSEHTVNGKHYPLELHLVHKNAKYEGTEFLNKPDGLAVVGVFFKLSPYDNLNLTPVTNKLREIRTAGSKTSLRFLNLLNFITLGQFLPWNLKGYRYKGSLTTPTCNEVVNWIVLANPIPISESQLRQFRKLKEGNETSPYILENFRPVQQLNGRQICSTKGIMKNGRSLFDLLPL